MKTSRLWLLGVVVSLLMSACSGSAPLATVAPTIPTLEDSPSLTPIATLSPSPVATATSTVAPQPSPTSAAITPLVFPKIDRHPAAADWGRGSLSSVPTYNPASDEQGQMDLRSYDLSGLDLSKSLNDLLYADFDARTKWPSADKMPTGFDWQKTMEMGKNPGLGIRSLHAQGLTGRGVGFAIIDQPLLTDHQEYADRMQLYEEIHIDPATESQMHGPAVTSIAVGKTVGVAPEVDLYYIGAWAGDFGTGGPDNFTYNFQYYAQAVWRILQINQQLPADHKIRVIAMQVGWQPENKGYDEIMAAVKEAKAEGLLVVSSSLEETFGFKFHGLGRAPLADPDKFESYEPGLWWAKDFYIGPKNRFSDRLLVPMDSRTTASPTGTGEYVFYREGGWSWSIPYIAGVYALAAQAQPSITPDQFWSLAMKTGRTIQLQHNGETIPFGPIIDPVALIAAIRAH
jgi:subtilisin family serine protease